MSWRPPTREDEHVAEVGFLHSEAILSYTVFLQLVQTMRVLQLTSLTGSFVYLLSRMMKDVIVWAIIYACIAGSFAGAIYVLFRNDRAPIGLHMWNLGDDCLNLETELSSIASSSLFLLRLTLDDTGVWSCFSQSSAPNPGQLLIGAFMVVVIIMLLNTLIAMMADTFVQVTNDSFKHYAFQFCRVLVSMRGTNGPVAPPLNLLGWPYHFARRLWELTTACLAMLRSHDGGTKRTPSVTTRARDPAVVQKITAVRAKILQDPMSKRHLERSIARFCRREDDALSVEDFVGVTEKALEPVAQRLVDKVEKKLEEMSAADRLSRLEGTLNSILAAVSQNAGGDRDRGGLSTSAPAKRVHGQTATFNSPSSQSPLQTQRLAATTAYGANSAIQLETLQESMAVQLEPLKAADLDRLRGQLRCQSKAKLVEEVCPFLFGIGGVRVPC